MYIKLFDMLDYVFFFLLGLTDVGYVIINQLHGVSDEVGARSRKMIYILAFYPLIDCVVSLV